ncbi:MAG: GAF domain-containing protein [Gaiellales bacterium]|jgi:two-component sensor histidine kinase
MREPALDPAERAARHLGLLSETVGAVTSSLDLAEVTDAVAVAVARAFGTDACFVYAYDEPSHDLVLQAVHGTHVEATAGPPRMQVGEGLTGWAAATREPVAIAADAHLDPRFKEFPNLPERRFQSLLAVPILDRRERLAGAMNVRTVAPREYHPDEIELLETIARQVAQAIENARLYERSQRRVAELEALGSISQAVAESLYLEEALAHIAEAAERAAHAEVCALVVDGPDDQEAVARRSSSAGPGDAELAALGARAPVDEPGVLAVPLLWKARRLGALVATTPGRRPFTPEERMLLGSVANQAAAAVESSRGVMRGIVAQEIHHRVKNNLQTVASLLRLRAAGPDPQRALDESVDRILSIAEVHDLLTASREGDVDLADLIRRVAGMLGHGLGALPAEQDLAHAMVPGDEATAVALVFSELYANALEHGGGDVAVRLGAAAGRIELVVQDAGPGLPVDFDPECSLGLKIARALTADQLRGELVLEDAGPGLRARLVWGAA